MCEYVNKYHDGKGTLHLLTQLPSDAIEVRFLKGLVGSIRKNYLWYNPKTHDIYKQNNQGFHKNLFPYLVIKGDNSTIGLNRAMKMKDLLALCEITFG